MLFIIAPFIWWPLALWYPSLDPGVQFSHESWSCGLSEWQFLGYTAFLNEPFPKKWMDHFFERFGFRFRDIYKNPCKESNRWKRTLPLVLVVIFVLKSFFWGDASPNNAPTICSYKVNTIRKNPSERFWASRSFGAAGRTTAGGSCAQGTLIELGWWVILGCFLWA